jgi:hypothetical protein
MSEISRARGILRSVGAVLAGAATGIVLSLGTDLALHAAGIFPALNEPAKFTSSLLLLATAYRTVYGVAGSYLTASLAPNRPMGHALALGALGLVASTVGAITMWNVGSHWYPLALIVTAMPTAWAGGKLYVMRAAGELA